MNVVLVAWLLGPAPIPAGAPTGPAPGTTQIVVEVLRVRTSALDVDAFTRELALRVPSARIVAHDAAPTSSTGFAVFVDVQRDGVDGWALTLVASDGRAYDRRVAAETGSSPDDEVRLLASNVGNLVAAIEAGTARHDRQDVAIPAPAEAVPACPACPPVSAPPPCPKPPIVTAKPAPLPPRLEIGVAVAPSIALGLGEPDGPDRFTAAGGDLGLWLRHRSGALLGADVRVAGRALAFDTSILRTRVGLHLGYAWRRDGFELATTAGFGIEPWSVRASGSRSELDDEEGAARTGRALLGGNLRVVPAHRFELRGVAVRVGPRLEIAASSAVGDGGRVAELFVVDDGELASIGRVGGWELGLGVDVMLWIPVRMGPRRRRR